MLSLRFFVSSSKLQAWNLGGGALAAAARPCFFISKSAWIGRLGKTSRNVFDFFGLRCGRHQAPPSELDRIAIQIRANRTGQRSVAGSGIVRISEEEAADNEADLPTANSASCRAIA